MAKRDSIKDMFETGIEIGRENATLLPEIKNWCRHLVLDDISGGLIAVTGLPTKLRVSCPHASGGTSGMQLGWVAGSFIEESCPCSFHSPITSDNFGNRLFAQKKAAQREVAIQKQRKEEAHQQLKTQIDTLVTAQKTTARITELSILHLLDSLKVEENKVINARNVYEASKLSPHFFPSLSLNVLSLYFEDEAAGGLCLLTASEVLKVRVERPAQVYMQTLKALRVGKYFNEAAMVLPYYITSSTIRQEEDTILILLHRLEYERFPGDSYGENKKYESCIAVLHYFITQDRAFLLAMFRKELQVDDKSSRINRNSCLQDLIELDASFVRELLPELVQSLELIDDQYMNSADYATCLTLAKLTKVSPQEIYPLIRDRVSRLSASTRKEGLRLYSLLLEDTAFTEANIGFSRALVLELIQQVMKKGENDSVHEAAVDELNRLRHDHIHLLAPHFDTLLGYFSQLSDHQKTFAWYKEEINTKKPEQISTFNPLQGLSFWEIQHKETVTASEMRDIKNILRKILQANERAHIGIVTQVLQQLDSKTQSKYKTELLNLLATSLQDPLVIASQLPALYNYLLDMDSVEVRMEGIKLLEHLIDNFPQLVTQTLLDLAIHFLTDPEVGIRGLAIALQATIAGSMPEKITFGIIDRILGLMMDNYVYVHKQAARKCIHFIPFMDKRQLVIAAVQLMELEKIHKEKDEEFSKEVVKNMLQLTKDIPQLFRDVTKRYVRSYCRSEEYYTAMEFIELLGEIKTIYLEFEDDWLQLVVDLFRRTSPDFPNNLDDRSELYNELHKLSYNCIQRQLNVLETFLQERKGNQGFDIIQILHLLCYFEFHEAVVRYVTTLPERIERVRSTEWLYRQAELILHFSLLEISVKNGNFYQNELKKIADVLQNAAS